VSRDPPPLLGFNNNVRHRGKIFHIQTEDSGIRHSRIVTHLFADGGRIVKTARLDYSEHVGREDMVPVVRRMMKEQHKGMFIALRGGRLDEILEQVCGPLPEAPSAAAARGNPAASASPDAPPSSSMLGSLVPESASSAPPSSTADENGPPRPRRQRTLSNPNLHRISPSAAPPSADVFNNLDMEALGRVMARDPSELQSGAPEVVPQPAAAARAAAREKMPSAPEVTPVLGSPPEPAEHDHPSGRYAASRPAAIFSPPPSVPSPERISIFGEELISEKSLDEVILSYLAEDLEGEKTPDSQK
jgi:hypothetical protein